MNKKKSYEDRLIQPDLERTRKYNRYDQSQFMEIISSMFVAKIIHL